MKKYIFMIGGIFAFMMAFAFTGSAHASTINVTASNEFTGSHSSNHNSVNISVSNTSHDSDWWAHQNHSDNNWMDSWNDSNHDHECFSDCDCGHHDDNCDHHQMEKTWHHNNDDCD